MIVSLRNSEKKTPIYVKELGTKRHKKRHILLQIIFYSRKKDELFRSNGDINKKFIEKALYKHFGKVWGRMFLALLVSCRQHRVEYVNKETKLMILSIPRDLQKFIISALPLFTNFDGLECYLRVLKVSGSMVKAQRTLVEYHLKNVAKLSKSARELELFLKEIEEIGEERREKEMEEDKMDLGE